MDSNWTFHTGLRSPNLTNTTVSLQENFEIDLEDTNWILTSSFIIFTMQTGFGMLESGCVSVKNEANIMMKNLADISLGGLTYWIFGYGLSFGQGKFSNPFIGVGDFLLDPPSHLILSIVLGGSSAFASALMLGPRLGRYAKGYAPLPLGNPVNAVMGTFVLWWGWLAFNSGSTYGSSLTVLCLRHHTQRIVLVKFDNVNIKIDNYLLPTLYCENVLMNTFTLLKNKGRADVMDLMNSILGSLVSITAGCFLYRAWEALIIGMIGALIASLSAQLFDRLRVDDPVGASAVHGACGFWGVVAVGLFADNPIPMETTNGRSGLFKGTVRLYDVMDLNFRGGWYLLGVQTLTAVCLMMWAGIVTMLLLWLIDKVLPIRMDPYEELLGADLCDHRIRHGKVGVSRAVSALRPFHRSNSIEEVGGIGVNAGHNMIIDKLTELKIKKNKRGPLKMFTNNGFIEDSTVEPISYRNNGFLNKRPGNPLNELHRAIDSMELELNGEKNAQTTHAKKPNAQMINIEDFKGKRHKELSVAELEILGEINSSQDRFRHRIVEDDYKDDNKQEKQSERK
ncbi:unnamed protein product [Leptidea sinapis]|uniref:Ammonium transporter AmtB-like domain-containing protein n=1 Tax=Leptidea sinapis TaxID=189913 RepID=A0A5E4QJ97_9NEOP|nr:unnamed protein product [Leptidea sinapis]